MVARIAVIRHNGLFYGGTEKFLQIMAAEVDHDEFEIDYYTSDVDRREDREQYLIDNDVNIIKFNIGKNYNTFPLKHINFMWRDLWKKLNKSNYDLIQITNFGWNELPYSGFHETDKLCEFTVFPPYVKFPGVRHHILNSEWLRDEWVKTGGSYEHSSAIPVPCKVTNTDNLRDVLNIDDGVVVCGFHQRADDRIFSPTQLHSYKQVESDQTHMVVLNGSRLYKEQAINLNIKNITFLDYAEEVSTFLNTLDIYTHGRRDGETYGMVLAEAMLHKCPCISHTSPIYNAMRSTIGPGGVVTRCESEYTNVLKYWIEHPSVRLDYTKKAYDYAHANYTYHSVIPRIENVWKTLIY